MSSEQPTASVVNDKHVKIAKQAMIKKSKKKTIDDYLYHIIISVFLAALLITFLSDYY